MLPKREFSAAFVQHRQHQRWPGLPAVKASGYPLDKHLDSAHCPAAKILLLALGKVLYLILSLLQLLKPSI